VAEQLNETTVDLLLTGGHVIDPASGTDGPAEVAISGGKIVAVGPNLQVRSAVKTIDLAGRYVTPGIIDMHVHAFDGHERSKLSLNPHVNTFSAGVTTVVDAGTAGWRDFPIFKEEIIDKAKIRILSYVNIVGKGMLGAWEHDIAEMKPKPAAAIADEYRDVVVGIKTAHYWTYKDFDDLHPAWAAVESAVEAGDLCGMPVMVDFCPWKSERSYQTMILEKLRPGDIHTHVFAQQFPIIDDAGKVFDHMWQARERGIIFDLGHGAGSFWYRNAVPAIRQGFIPDSISTDLHTGNVHGVVIDMLTTMNKILAIGVPLHQVIAMSTTAPAREINHPELGTLSPGSDADVAVFDMERGDFAFVDCGRTRFPATEKLRCALTVRAGEIVYNPDGLGLPLWDEAGETRTANAILAQQLT
jgi:dihydroorotase